MGPHARQLSEVSQATTNREPRQRPQSGNEIPWSVCLPHRGRFRFSSEPDYTRLTLAEIVARMNLTRGVGILLSIPGAILTIVGGTTPCSQYLSGPTQSWTPSCGQTLVTATVGVFLLAAGVLVIVWSARGDRTRHSMKRLALALGASALAVVLTIATLAVAPIHQSFRMHGAEVWDLENSCSGIDSAKGTLVSFHWSAATSISFGAWSCSADRIVYQENGTNGLGAFISEGGLYSFGAICPSPGPPPCVPADVYGTYTGPLLPL